ncbi:MAG: 50S ribosomal protein L30 [Holosporaceae bacterium]|nr:50S ribosomal protein L30 [Holosporaceae bacterium]
MQERKICIVQVRSGARCMKRIVLCLKALGLGQIGKKVFLEDCASVKGLLRKVSHLVKEERDNV